MDLIARLNLMQSTLNGISVSGRDNLERLLGSMQEIDRIVFSLQDRAQPTVLQERGIATKDGIMEVKEDG